MERLLSQKLRQDVDSSVRRAIATEGLVNVPYLAEMIRMRHLSENVAREDIELLVLQRAQAHGVAMSFAPAPIFAHQTDLIQ